jgi:creatinine amidohydrolase
MMLHLHPDRVRTGKIRRFASLGEELEAAGSRILPEGPAAFAWLAGDLNRSGAVGDAGLATAELGRLLVEHYGDALAAIIRDARDFPIDRLA